MASRFPPPLIAAALVAGCAQAGDFPSLAPRPAESGAAAPAPATPAPVTPADPALAARLSALLDQARAGQTAFEAARPDAEAKIARAGSSGSESWIAAQMALSRLESARGPTVAALSDLDALSRERSGAGANPDDLAAIAAAIAGVGDLADGQQAILTRLGAALPSG